MRPKPIVRKVLSLLIPLVILYLVVCLATFMLQRSLIYHPTSVNSADYPIEKIERSGDFFAISSHPIATEQAVVYFGGNAEDVTLTMDSLVKCFDNHAVYALHYPGYGGSPGRPNQSNIVENATLLYELVHKKHSQVIVVGRSLGSGVAMQVARHSQPNRLILVTPFDCLAEVGQATFPILPVRWLMLDRYDSASVAPSVNCPVLVLAAAQDEVVPKASTERLVSQFPTGVCEYHVINPANHNSLELPVERIQTFLNSKQQ